MPIGLGTVTKVGSPCGVFALAKKKVENAETLESSIQYSAALNTFSNTTSHCRLHHMNRFICKSLGLVLLFQRAGMVRAELARGDWWNLDFLLVGP